MSKTKKPDETTESTAATGEKPEPKTDGAGEKPAEPKTDGPPKDARPFEEWAAELATPAWLLRCTKIRHGWAQGRYVTRAEYVKAVDVAANERHG